MKVGVPYGKINEAVEIADERLMAVVVPRDPGVGPVDPAAVVRAALTNPIGAPSLCALARGKKTVALIVSDHTRPAAGSHKLAPLVLAELERGGIRPENLTIIAACGLHQQVPLEAYGELLRPEVMARYKVVLHDPDAPDLVDLGLTPTNRIPVKVSRLAWQADLRLSIGQVEPHGVYGWSGGAKHILPGVAGRQTVCLHHGRSSKLGALAVVEGNVFRADAEEAARMAKLDFILNVVLDERREVIGAFAGDMVAAHRAAVEFAARFKVVKVPGRAQIVIVAIGGLPRDVDFWQAQGKGLYHAQGVLADGGVMILASGCRDGMGAQEYREILSLSIPEIRRLYADGRRSVALDKSMEICDVLDRASLFLVCPGLKPGDLPRLPVTFFGSVEAALDEATKRIGRSSSVLAIPDASRVAAVPER